MTTAIDKLREALNASKNKGGNTGGKGGNRAARVNDVYPFWEIPFDGEAVLRFLPDSDESNPFFWRHRDTITLTFAGIVGGENETTEEAELKIQSMSTFGESCRITQHCADWWDEGDARRPIASKYYRKRNYIYQGFVVSSDFNEPDEAKPESPIRRFSLNKGIHATIEDSLLSSEFEDMPTDYVGGHDFRIKKTRNGAHASYVTSGWRMKPRSLSEQERIAIEQFGVKPLSEFQGKRLTQEEQDMTYAMFLDSLEGKPFDFASYGHAFRPFVKRGGGFQRGGSAPAAAAPAPVSTAAAPQVSAPVPTFTAPVQESAPAADAGAPKMDISAVLAEIASRQQGGQ